MDEHTHHGISEDPSGYGIRHDKGGRFVLFRHEDGSEVGRYDSREEAIEAAEQDRDA